MTTPTHIQLKKHLTWLALFIVLSTGCAAHLPPHVYVPINPDAGIFYWRDTGICQMRVVYLGRGEEWNGLTVTVNPMVCRIWLKAEGFDVRGIAQ